MEYNKISWQNGEAGMTPISDVNLGIMDNGIKNNNNMILNGWNELDVTLTLSSTDNNIFTLTTNTDLTNYLSAGMKIKLTQITDKFFIVVKEPTATTIVLYGGTDYTITNDTISNVYFSISETPYKFNKNVECKYAIALKETAQTINDATFTDIELTSVNDGIFEIDSGKIKYVGENDIVIQINSKIEFSDWNSNITSPYRVIAMYTKNGVQQSDDFDEGVISSGGEPLIKLATNIFILEKNDILGLILYQNTGEVRNIGTNTKSFINVICNL